MVTTMGHVLCADVLVEYYNIVMKIGLKYWAIYFFLLKMEKNRRRGRYLMGLSGSLFG